MRNSKLLLIMMILPWFSLPLLRLKTIKRFLPATIFISFVTIFINVIAKKRNWWQFYSSIHPKVNGMIPFIFGPEFLLSLWFLKWTYGRFSLFLTVNTVAQIIFAFPIMELIKKLGIVSLIRINHVQFLLLFLMRSFLLYGFQIMMDSITGKIFLRK